MSNLRLTFLYPHLFRSIRISEPATQTIQRCPRQCASQRAPFATTSRKPQRFVERHGKAVEPFLQPGETKDDTKVFVPESKSEPVKKVNGKGSKKSRIEEGNKDKTETLQASLATPLPKDTEAAENIPGDIKTGDLPKISSEQEGAVRSPQLESPPPEDGPLKQVLSFELPTLPNPEELHIPHLHPPQYVHNFDSWTLVKEVEKGGFTPEQAITAMKAVRGLLAKNLDVAKEGLVSKSDVENETYLFRAACSELRIEIQNSRRASDENMRRERTLLQHEVEILNQKLTQELLTLKDELTGMFNDRKMAVRMDQRSMESAIQELNYQITVALNSDSKSEVEGLRWVLTRRAVLALVFMALMVLSSLRYASYRAHEEELERKRQERMRDADARHRAMIARERERDGEMIDEGSQTDGQDGRRDLSPGVAVESLAAN